MVENDETSEIAEAEVFFALDDNGTWGIGRTPDEARENLLCERDDGIAVRSFSINVRARKPHVELGPEIDIADKDVEVASVAEGDGKEAEPTNDDNWKSQTTHDV